MMACAFSSLAISARRDSSCFEASAASSRDSNLAIHQENASAGSRANAAAASSALGSIPPPVKYVMERLTAPAVSTTSSAIASATRPHNVMIPMAPAGGEMQCSQLVSNAYPASAGGSSIFDPAKLRSVPGKKTAK
jgi:hypothetical protein